MIALTRQMNFKGGRARRYVEDVIGQSWYAELLTRRGMHTVENG